MNPKDLLAEFDAWEERLRGLAFWPVNVSIEPPFVPLFAESRVARGVVDDARKPSLLERLSRYGGDETATVPSTVSPPPSPAMVPPLGNLITIELLLGPDMAVKPEAAKRFLTGLHTLTKPASFEVISSANRTVVQIVCDEADRFAMTGILRSYLPEARTRVRQDRLPAVCQDEARYASIINFALAERVFRPLRMVEKFDIDPLAEIVGALEEISDGETGIVQVLFQPASARWGKELEQFASSIDDVDKIGPQIREKFAEPVFAVVMRVAAFTQDEQAAGTQASNIARSVFDVTRSEENELAGLVPLDHFGAADDFDAEITDLVERATHRSGMLLSLSELLTIVHPPSSSVRSERLARLSIRTKPAPVITKGHALILGTNEHDGETKAVSLSPEQRRLAVYAIGGSGTGKSTLLLSMAAQDIAVGNGFAVLDPHGDLVEDILSRIPEERANDVILFDPADEAYPIGFNILSAHSELERTLLASDLVSVFKRLSTTFGDVMVSVLGNAALAFLESKDGGTLLDLRNFLIDPAFRARVLQGVRDEEIVSYWKREFTLLKGMPHAPVLTRLNAFLRPKLIRRMVAQKNDRVDFRRVMDSRTIFLAKLSHGAIGEENAYLLGSLLVSKFAQAAMSRQNLDVAKRRPYFLYIDEFHHFVTPSIANILSGARKYGLGLVLAHQEGRQLKSRSEEVASAVLANAGMRVVFRVGEQDAKALAEGFSFFEARDLQSLGVGEAVARVERADFDFNLHIQRPDPVDPALAAARRAAAVAASRAGYATPRDEVDALLASKVYSQENTEEPAAERTGRRRERANTEDGPTLPGRGGAEHKYIQDLIRRLGEERGFIVSIEKRILGGHGHVDVALERDGLSIGCEISMTTRAAHEAGNMAKLIAAGFDYAVFITSKDRVRKAMREALGDAESSRIRFLTPDAFVALLDEIAPRESAKRKKASTESATQLAERPAGLVSAERAAAYVGLQPQTLAKMRVKGTSPPFHKIGSRVLYDVADLDAWIAARKQRSTSDTRTPRT